MIIQQLSNKLRGYLPKDHEGAVAPFFPCVNMAFRREVVDELGGFDETLANGEDIDFCVRALDSRWELFYNPEVAVEHLGRSTVRALARQWFDYGLHHASLFVKHNRSAVEVLLPSPWHAFKNYTVAYDRAEAPVRAVLFVSSFAVMHGALAAAGLCGVVGLRRLAAASLAVAAGAAVRYFRDDVRRDAPLATRLSGAALRYLVNASMVAGGLVGGLRHGMLYVDSVVEKRT